MAKIEKLSWEDVLTDFHNRFLTDYISAELDLRIYREISKKEGEKVQVNQRPVQIGMDEKGKPIMQMVKVTAKEGILEAETRLKNFGRILKTIDEVRKERFYEQAYLLQ
jgi:hypothetical protein